MKHSKKALTERFFRLKHLDPEVGIEQIEQTDEVRELVAQIKHELDLRKEERRSFELQWRLNQNFFAGNQYCDVVESTGEVVDMEPTFDWEMRMVYNQIAPIIETRLSKLSRVSPGLTVRPVTNDTRDVTTARMSTRLLKNSFLAHDMSKHAKDASMWSEICGGVFYKSTWNPNAGLLMGYHDGKPVYEGDISTTVVPYYEIFPSTSYVSSLDECDSVIHAKVYTVDEIHLRWGVQLEGREMNCFSMEMSGMRAGGVGYNPSMMQIRDNIIDDAELVIEYYERPNRYFPQGRYAIIAGDILVHIGVLPFRCGSFYRRGYPFVHQRCLETTGCLWGTSVIDRLIPVQRDYNAVRNRINEYIARMTIGNMLVEQSSLVDEGVLESGLAPGTVVEYKAGSNPPAWMMPQEIPATLLNQVEQLHQEFINISGVSEMSRTSQTPAAISSGTALEILKEQDDTRLALTAENMRDAFRDLGRQWLRLYKQFVTVPRVTRIAGESAGDVAAIVWRNNDITSDDVVVDTDNEMTNTPAQRKQLALELLQVGLFNDPDTGRMTRENRAKLMEIFELGNWESIIDVDELQTARAQREQLQLEDGTLPQVMELDDHPMHISEHTKYVLSAEFRSLQEQQPALARGLLEHIAQHKEITVQRSLALSGAGGATGDSTGYGAQAAEMASSGVSQGDALSIAAKQQGRTGGTH